MRFLFIPISSIFVVSSAFAEVSASPCHAGDLSLYAGKQEVQADKTETAPIYGASMNFGNQCPPPMWGVQLNFSAKLAAEHSQGKLDGQDLTVMTVGAGPSWCFEFSTGTSLCAAYLVRDSQFKTDEAKVNYGSLGVEYGITQAVGSFVGKAAYSSSAYRTGAETVTLRSYTLGLGYAL